MESSTGTLSFKDLSKEEVGLLKKIVELGVVFEFFGDSPKWPFGQEWAFPRPDTRYVDSAGIEKNVLFNRITQTGLIKSEHTSNIRATALIWRPIVKAIAIITERNWV